MLSSAKTFNPSEHPDRFEPVDCDQNAFLRFVRTGQNVPPVFGKQPEKKRLVSPGQQRAVMAAANMR